MSTALLSSHLEKWSSHSSDVTIAQIALITPQFWPQKHSDVSNHTLPLRDSQPPASFQKGESHESPLGSKEIKPVNPIGKQPWKFIERTDAEVEDPILWPPDAKSQLIGKDPDAGEDWGQEEKGAAQNEMVGWHHQLDGHESEQALGDSEGQGSLECCSAWGCKQSNTTVTEKWQQMPDWSASQSISTPGLPLPSWIAVSCAELLHTACQAEVLGSAVLHWKL